MDHPQSDEDTLVADPVESAGSGASAGEPTHPEAKRTPKLDNRQLARGDELGRYMILERVGAGGMGVVFAAWDPKLDRKVALKLLHGDKQAHAQRLIREAHAMARLSHPNVVTVYDADRATLAAGDERVFVAMEFVEGRTLTEWAGLGPSPSDSRVEAPPEREWSEVLEVVLAAGRGLAAAHAQGLVHRDFKPDNVMIDADGRVRVMDFGLVREAGSSEGTTVEELDDEQDQQQHDSADATPLEQRPHMHMQIEGHSAFEQLTLAGALLGTPAYMAPEQLRGEAADARSDQFSFCVVAWQCLYGERPFAGDTPLAMMFAIAHGSFREGLSGRVVPTRIRRVLERGLASDPQARWPDMPSLLTALSYDPRARRRPAQLAAASLALSLLAATAAIVHEPTLVVPPCAHAGEEMSAWWSAPREAELAAAFDRSELVYADESWTRVSEELDRWAHDWVQARHDACEDTEVRQTQSAELLDLRTACLDQRLHGFRALVDVLANADDTVIERAVEAVEALPTLEVCADRSWLSATLRPPEQPELAAAVERVRASVARAEALSDGGKPADALPLAEQAEAEARELAWQPLLAEASTTLGHVRQELGDFAGSRDALETGYFAARRSGHDEITVEAAYLLIYSNSLGLAEFEAADRWSRHALAEAERIARPELLAEVEAGIGINNYLQGKLEPAAQAFARALELQAGRPSTGLASAHINYGTVLIHVDLSQRAHALAELELGRAMLIETLGPRHPSVAVALNNYATVLGEIDEFARAAELLDQALLINRDALGEQHPMTALIELNLSTNLSEPDERMGGSAAGYARALELAEHTLVVHRAVFGDRHTRVAESQKAIARALWRLARADEALSHLDVAQEIWRETFGETHEKIDATLLLRAKVLVSLGRIDEALVLLERLSQQRQQFEPSMRLEVQLTFALALVERDPARARALLDELAAEVAAADLISSNSALAQLRDRLRTK